MTVREYCFDASTIACADEMRAGSHPLTVAKPTTPMAIIAIATGTRRKTRRKRNRKPAPASPMRDYRPGSDWAVPENARETRRAAERRAVRPVRKAAR